MKLHVTGARKCGEAAARIKLPQVPGAPSLPRVGDYTIDKMAP